MIKGCQREMIVLKTRESELFESAYFILRRQKREPAHADMLSEANRIIGGQSRVACRKKRRKKWGIALFLSGFLAGGGIGLLLWLLF